MMMMSFICSFRNKTGAELHRYLEEGTYHKRLFRGTSTNDMKKSYPLLAHSCVENTFYIENTF
jgi:hypothetical protein